MLLTSKCTQHIYHQLPPPTALTKRCVIPKLQVSRYQISANVICWQGGHGTGCQICCCAICAFPGVHHRPEVASDSQQSFGSEEAMPCCFGSSRLACDSCCTRVKRHWTLRCTMISMEIDDLLVLPAQIVYTGSVVYTAYYVGCRDSQSFDHLSSASCLSKYCCCDSSDAASCIAL